MKRRKIEVWRESNNGDLVNYGGLKIIKVVINFGEDEVFKKK